VKQTQFRNVDPPLWVAWNQALASIRVRFLRHSITTAGISLGIAFFASIQAMNAGDVAKSATDPNAADRLKWLVATSLVMCLVGVTNSMLMSVTERFREIGTIKCLGASDGFIVKVFFLEALILGAFGSVVGSVVGTMLMAAVSVAGGSSLPTGAILSTIGLGSLVGVCMTVVAAIMPAIQAARMPAAAALRMDA
jgi:putative ABC transport system permease protein